MPRSPPANSLVVLSGNSQLPAELRLGQAISEFAQGLDNASKQTFHQLQAELNRSGPLTPADVITLTERLNREGARRHPAWRPAAGTRLGGFLRRIQQFATFGDILIGGSQNLIASGVWATVRTMLEATICHHVYFDQVSSLLMHLTTSWTITQDFVQHFPGSKELQIYLAEYLIRVVRVCQQILEFSQRSPVMLLAASIFSSFEAEFLPLQQELDKWGLLIEKLCASLTTKAVLEGQVAMTKGNRDLTRFITADSRRQMLFESQQRLLSALSPNQETFDLIFRRERKRGNCSWLLGNPDYISWKTATCALLHLTGHLGSGKTVGMANIASDLAGRGGGCAYFFCKRDFAHTQTRKNIIGSILHQIIYNNLKTCTWTSLEDGCRLPAGPISVDSVLRLLPSLLPKEQEYSLLIDGLEECPQVEFDDTIQTLLNLQASFRISLCVSARTGSHRIRTILASTKSIHTISLNSPTRDIEMQQYIRSEVQVRNSRRALPFTPELESQIVEQLAIGSQGMYLWVSLQLEALFPSHPHILTNDETVVDILGKLPNSLPEAFDQALARILDRRYGMKLFGLVATAEEPLTGDQLRVALTVEPGSLSWQLGKLPHDSRQLVHCCGGTLLEMDEEDGKVRYIHHSVVAHLAVSQRNQEHTLRLSWLEESDLTMGLICTTYLSYGIFDTRVSTTQDVDAKAVIDSATGAAKSSSPLFAHLIRHIKHGKRQALVPKHLNILNVLHQARFSAEDDILGCFLPYASKYWLQHTRFINAQEHGKVFSLWRTILEEKSDSVKTPWYTHSPHLLNLMDFALDQSHHCLFQHTIRSLSKFSLLSVIRGLLAAGHPRALAIRGPWLENALALCIAPGPPVKSELLRKLVDLGASPAFPLDNFPCDEDRSLGIWKLAGVLFNDSTIDRTIYGLPLLQAIFQSASSLATPQFSLGLDRSTIADWFFKAIRSGWYDALALLVERSNMASFNKVGFSLDAKLGELHRCVSEVTTNKLAILQLLMEHGAHVGQTARNIYRAEAWKELRRLQNTFTPKVLQVRNKNTNLSPISQRKSTPVYQSSLAGFCEVSLRRHPSLELEELEISLSHGKIYYYLEEFSSPDLLEPLGWAVESTNYFMLMLWIKPPSTIEGLCPLSGWSSLLRRTLMADHPKSPEPESHEELSHWWLKDIPPKEKMVSDLISWAKSQGVLDKPDHQGFTALHHAAMWGPSLGFSPIKLLLQAGADPNVLSLTKHTPLEVALSSELGIKDIKANVSDLLQAGADPNKRCSNGLMPLHLAVSFACPDITGLLIDQASADVREALTVSLSTKLELSLKVASLVSSIDGLSEDKLQEWGNQVKKVRTIWGYYYVWRQTRFGRRAC